MSNTFPTTFVTDLERTDSVFGGETQYANLPCLFCMAKGEFDRFKQARRATKVVAIADLMKVPLCDMHAEEFVGDKR
jgi:hypothetical protein